MNIRERREQLGISQKELAEKCEIAQSTLCDIEMGRIKPSLPVAIKLADSLKLKKEAKAMKQGQIVKQKMFE